MEAIATRPGTANVQPSVQLPAAVQRAISNRSSGSASGSRLPVPASPGPASTDPAEDPVREAFTQFVGETFFGQMLAAMRSTTKPPAYFHGGRAEEMFQGQLDQQLAGELAQSSAHSLADPMYELFSLGRR